MTAPAKGIADSGSAIADLGARREALDPSRSFIVQAPAGSGKTELLIQRTLRLLALVDEPEEISAITFTRKAAGEMRKRVLEALARAAREPRPEESAEPHRALTWDLARAALDRDSARGWELGDNASRLRIQTIDSLCASLTRQMPVLSRFGAQPESAERDEAEALYREAARATLALLESGAEQDRDSADDVARLLMHLDNNLGAAEALIAGALAERDKWLRNLSGAHDREALEAALERVRREAMERAHSRVSSGNAAVGELLAVASRAASNLVAAGSASPLVACEALGVLPGAEEEDLPVWQGLAELLLTQAGEPRKTGGLNVRIGFPPGVSKAEKEAAKAAKERAGALIAALAGDPVTRDALHALRSLPPPRYDDAQWETLGAIARLVRRATGELRVVFGAQARADFVEVAHRASDALGSDEEPTELALALDYRIRHLLVDEFQDTSFTQYELLRKLTAGWQPDDGRSLFLVGDPMQSIYRFRQAEVGLFLRARRDGLGGVELHPLTLSVNFRSQRGVVDWVNAAFRQVMPAAENVAAGAVPYTDSVARHEALPGEAVSVHPLLAGEGAAEQEAARVVQIAREAQADDAQGTIAILVRSRGVLDAIVPALREAGLRYRAIDIEHLGHRQPVQDLLALTRALCHPADRLAWLSLLRAPWCGLTLTDLHALCNAGEAVGDAVNLEHSSENPEAQSDQAARSRNRNESTLRERMHDAAVLARLSPDGRARLERVREVLEAALAERLRVPLRDSVEGVWLALGGPACAEARNDLEDAGIFLDRLDALEEAGTVSDLDALEQSVQHLFAAPDPDADARIEIMTIHKAKGLEFDTVIVPGLGRGTPPDDARLFRWIERPALHDPAPGFPHGSELLLAPIKQAGAQSDAIYDFIKQLDAERGGHEDGRLLYVAATRAKRRLHLLGTASASDKSGTLDVQGAPRGSLLARLWPAVGQHYQQAAASASLPAGGTPPASTSASAASAAGGAPEQRIDQSLRRLPSGWRAPELPPAAAWTTANDPRGPGEEIEFSWVSEAARQVGNVVHRWLQRIAEDELRGWDRARVESLREGFRRELAAHGVASGEIDEAVARIAAALATAVSEERGRWLLGPHPEAASEQRIRANIDGRPRTLVIDRRFTGSDGRHWIADFKTSRHEGSDPEGFLDRERERYRAQLERYARALGLNAASLGLYFPQLGGWREWTIGDPGPETSKTGNRG